MITSDIKLKALQLDYLACGVIPADIFDEYARALDRRVEAFPASKKYYEPFYAFAQLPENAKSIIVCTKSYTGYKVSDSLSGLIGKCYMFDYRMDYSPGYRAKAEFVAYLKTLGIGILENPVPDRLAAAKAGIGKFGRNNFIYDPQEGSNIWVDAWAVDKELEYDPIEEDMHLSACSDGCNICIESCPTKALSGSFSMDMGKCINRITTIEKSVPDENTRTQLGRWLYGCDVCQDSCPLNQGKWKGSKEFPLLSEYEEYLKPERILEMDDDTYKSIVNPRFWYSGEDALWLWKCNALRSMINSGDKKYHGLIRTSCDHEDARIREIALWGCGKLDK